MSDGVPIVIDNGSRVCKAGLAGEAAPRSVFPTFIGRRRFSNSVGSRQIYIGNSVNNLRGILTLEYPIQNGYVNNWNVMEDIWNYLFEDELRESSHEHPVLITEPPLNPKLNREKMTEIFFENFGVPAFYVANPCVLSLYSSGRVSGVVLDSGDCVSHVVPIYAGFAFPHAIQRLNLAGRHLNEYLARILTERNYYYNQSSAHEEIVREIKEKLCYVALDAHNENGNEDSCTLPDGTTITLATERYRCPEALFKPELLGRESIGIHEFVHRAIIKCDMDIRRDLFANVVLAGGTTMFPGFKARLESELVHLAPNTQAVKVAAPPDRKDSVWIGGSVLASYLSDIWITKAEYDENGARIVHRKCF